MREQLAEHAADSLPELGQAHASRPVLVRQNVLARRENVVPVGEEARREHDLLPHEHLLVLFCGGTRVRLCLTV